MASRTHDEVHQKSNYMIEGDVTIETQAQADALKPVGDRLF